MGLLDKFIPFTAAVKKWPLSTASYESYARTKPEKLPPIYWFNNRRYFLRADVAAWEPCQITRDPRSPAQGANANV